MQHQREGDAGQRSHACDLAHRGGLGVLLVGERLDAPVEGVDLLAQLLDGAQERLDRGAQRERHSIP